MATKVSASLKLVRNLGNFESVHIEIGVEDEKRENETVREAMDRVYAVVESEVDKRMNQAIRDLTGSN